MSLSVLGGGVSPFVRKVRATLAEKGLDYTFEPINPFAPPAGWREISPLGKIPAFKDGDRTLNDSSVICAYLEKKFPDAGPLPHGSVRLRARSVDRGVHGWRPRPDRGA